MDLRRQPLQVHGREQVVGTQTDAGQPVFADHGQAGQVDVQPPQARLVDGVETVDHRVQAEQQAVAAQEKEQDGGHCQPGAARERQGQVEGEQHHQHADDTAARQRKEHGQEHHARGQQVEAGQAVLAVQVAQHLAEAAGGAARVHREDPAQGGHGQADGHRPAQVEQGRVLVLVDDRALGGPLGDGQPEHAQLRPEKLEQPVQGLARAHQGDHPGDRGEKGRMFVKQGAQGEKVDEQGQVQDHLVQARRALVAEGNQAARITGEQGHLAHPLRPRRRQQFHQRDRQGQRLHCGPGEQDQHRQEPAPGDRPLLSPGATAASRPTPPAPGRRSRSARSGARPRTAGAPWPARTGPQAAADAHWRYRSSAGGGPTGAGGGPGQLVGFL